MATGRTTLQPVETTASFVARHALAVRRYLRMHGADPHTAEDLTQEAFVTALQKGAMDLEPAAAQAFLRRAARYAFLHQLRAGRRATLLADAVDELWERDAQDDGGERLVEAVRGCVERLEGRAAEAVRSAYGIDRPAVPRDDLAAALALQPNGLKTLLQRTRQLLRACLERNLR